MVHIKNLFLAISMLVEWNIWKLVPCISNPSVVLFLYCVYICHCVSCEIWINSSFLNSQKINIILWILVVGLWFEFFFIHFQNSLPTYDEAVRDRPPNYSSSGRLPPRPHWQHITGRRNRNSPNSDMLHNGRHGSL